MYYDESCVCLLPNCNWSCGYCISINNSSKIDEDQIFKQFYDLKDTLSKKLISGGEPGLLSESFWSRFFNCIDHKVIICTNGTFIKKGLFDKFRPHIKQIVLHCVPELDCDIDNYILEFLGNPTNRTLVQPVIVVHNHNSHLLGSFLEKYKDIGYIELHLTDSKFCLRPNYDYAIGRKSAEDIIRQLGPYPQYKAVLTRLTIALIENNFLKLNIGSSRNHYPSL